MLEPRDFLVLHIVQAHRKDVDYGLIHSQITSAITAGMSVPFEQLPWSTYMICHGEFGFAGRSYGDLAKILVDLCNRKYLRCERVTKRDKEYRIPYFPTEKDAHRDLRFALTDYGQSAWRRAEAYWKPQIEALKITHTVGCEEV